MMTCVKGGARRRDVVKVCGAGEFHCRYNRLKCYQARFHVEKHVLETGPALPPTAIRDLNNEILVRAEAVGELVPV